MRSKKAYILDALVPDLVSDFLYYDRKEDELLPRGSIEAAVRNGELSWEEIADRFRQELLKNENAEKGE
ncbi:MAG: hypothetical protein HKP37_08100 [Boseongicola sp.]|nr:hypothetical protein [Boseongicola sp.]